MGAKIGTRPASVIGPDATLRGDVNFVGDVKVEGAIAGNLRCASLYLTSGGVISGDVTADRVLVSGRVSGSIESREIYLKCGAVVEGDISHHQLTVEKGAILKGTSFPSEEAVVSATTDTEGVVRPDFLPRIVSAGREMLSSLRIPSPNLQWNFKPKAKAKAKTEAGEAEQPTKASGLSGQLDWAGPVLQRLQDGLRSSALFLRSAVSTRSVSPPGFLERPEKPKPFRRYRLHILSPLTNFTIFAVLAVFAVARAYDPDPASNYPLSKTLEVPSDRELILFDAKGKEFARRGGCVDAAVSLDEIPQHFIDALLATEDRRFFVHFGIDPVGILRAARTNYEAGKIVQGGSTITQQLAKISYLSSEKSFDRKFKEAIAVLRLEATLTKREILERYLSRAYFGEGCFGLRAASRHYFKQNVSDLTVPQSAMLVALLKSPSQLSQDKDALDAREELVLNAMVDYGRLDAAERAEIQLAKTLNTPRPLFGAFYADWIADTAKVKKSGKLAPLPIRTSFDQRLQRAADAAVEKTLRRSGRRLRAGQAALVAMRPDGRVLAMVGGRNYTDSQFNRASQALRQPGSSFKAFVYLAAARAGGRPDMMVADVPITIGDWTPRNYDGRYRGIMPLRRAFSSSINTVSVRLTQAVGPHQVAMAARDLGITTPVSDEHISIALGTSEVTLVDLTSAYAAFSANAYPIKPWGVLSAGSKKAKSAKPPKGAGRWKLMESGTMRQFLQATVQAGTGRAARLSIPSYGKTGTSQNYRDAWFVGFAGNLVVGVWVGNDDNTPMRRVTGGNLPAQIWKEFMSNALRIDKKSRRAPTQIAGFRAKPSSRRSSGVGSATLMSMLMDQEYMYASYGSGAYFGNAMMIGRPQYGTYPGYGQGYPNYRRGYPGYGQGYPGYRQGRHGVRQVKRRQRSGGSWDPFSGQN